MMRLIGFRRHPLIDPEALLALLDRVPRAHRERLTAIRYAPPCLQIPSLGGPVRIHSGVYNEDLRAILIGDCRDAEHLKEVVLHELGHHVYRRVITPSQRREWVLEIYPGSEFVSEYARRNASEDFAECYASFVLDPSRLRRIPRKYNFLAARFGAPAMPVHSPRPAFGLGARIDVEA